MSRLYVVHITKLITITLTRGEMVYFGLAVNIIRRVVAPRSTNQVAFNSFPTVVLQYLCGGTYFLEVVLHQNNYLKSCFFTGFRPKFTC